MQLGEVGLPVARGASEWRAVRVGAGSIAARRVGGFASGLLRAGLVGVGVRLRPGHGGVCATESGGTAVGRLAGWDAGDGEKG